MASCFLIPPRNYMCFRKHALTPFLTRAYAAEACPEPQPALKKGLVLGVYTEKESRENKLTPAGQKFSSQTGGKLEELIREGGRQLTLGKTSVFQNLDPEYNSVCVVGLGKEGLGYSACENLDEGKENARIAAAKGSIRLRRQGCSCLNVEGMGHPEASAEGAALAVWRYQENKNKEHQKIVPQLELYYDEDKDSWQRGIFKAEAQNLARRLSDSPANLMTPTIFVQNAVDALCPCGISVEIRDKEWMESKKMNAILTVARGSCEAPLFMELSYCGGGADDKPIVFVGKGITFDTGGLCLKKCKGMSEYRGDMAGAAVIVAVMRAAAALSLPLNLQAVLPLCENMPSGMAMKPGDVICAMNGKTIVIDNTDNEGQLLLADALYYASCTLKPSKLIDVATLTGGMRTAVGSASSGVFTNCDASWNELMLAGTRTGDRVWRFPLWSSFTHRVTKLPHADISNVGWGVGGEPCRAAAFLREFVSPDIEWIHIDIASTGMLAHTNELAYLKEGRMTGRPTRTIVQFLYQLACNAANKDRD